MIEYDIVTYLINTDRCLYETYKFYQTVLYYLDTRNKNILSMLSIMKIQITV